MKVAPYWEHQILPLNGMTFRVRAFSFRSRQEARERMLAKVKILSDFYAPGHDVRSEDAVARFRRSLRELDEQSDPESYSVVIAEQILHKLDEQNIITRNRYGVQVLNTSELCILDVDSFRRPWKQCLLGLIGRGMTEEACLLDAAHALAARDERLGLRVYRTARGWRVIAGGRRFAPDGESTASLNAALQVDPLYARLCISQKCWRARLTPKPRRLGMLSAFPAPSENDELTLEASDWLEVYEKKSANVAVCRLIETFGVGLISGALDLHDSMTHSLCADLPLG